MMGAFLAVPLIAAKLAVAPDLFPGQYPCLLEMSGEMHTASHANAVSV